MSLRDFVDGLERLERLSDAARAAARLRPLGSLVGRDGIIDLVEVSPGVFASPTARNARRPNGAGLLRELTSVRDMQRELRSSFEQIERGLLGVSRRRNR